MNTESSVGSPYIALSVNMLSFYARRGMWTDDKPAGLLATWLGERCPWKSTGCTVVYWTTHDGLDALAADAESVPPQAWPTPHQRAQFLRRLREAAIRAGGAGDSPTRLAAPSTSTPHAGRALPFEPLCIPAEGSRARQAFADHVMRTMREFVDYTQGSEFQGLAP